MNNYMTIIQIRELERINAEIINYYSYEIDSFKQDENLKKYVTTPIAHYSKLIKFHEMFNEYFSELVFTDDINSLNYQFKNLYYENIIDLILNIAKLKNILSAKIITISKDKSIEPRVRLVIANNLLEHIVDFNNFSNFLLNFLQCKSLYMN